MAMVPSYISRSVAGSYDLEGVAIFALVFTFYLYVKVSAKSWLLISSQGVRMMRARLSQPGRRNLRHNLCFHYPAGQNLQLRLLVY